MKNIPYDDGTPSREWEAAPLTDERKEALDEYTEGVMYDGTAILKNGNPMTISEILCHLKLLQRDPQGMVRALQYALEITTKCRNDAVAYPYNLVINKIKQALADWENGK